MKRQAKLDRCKILDVKQIIDLSSFHRDSTSCGDDQCCALDEIEHYIACNNETRLRKKKCKQHRSCVRITILEFWSMRLQASWIILSSCRKKNLGDWEKRCFIDRAAMYTNVFLIFKLFNLFLLININNQHLAEGLS